MKKLLVILVLSVGLLHAQDTLKAPIARTATKYRITEIKLELTSVPPRCSVRVELLDDAGVFVDVKYLTLANYPTTEAGRLTTAIKAALGL